MTAPDPLAKTCPLCGADNQCAMANGKPPESCWCQSVQIDPEALARVPEASRNKHCICQACGSITESKP